MAGLEDALRSVSVYGDSPDEGLARGELKLDGGLVPSNGGITGSEVIAKSDLHYEIAVRALEIHDKLVEAGEVGPNSGVREHILRIIEEAKHG